MPRGGIGVIYEHTRTSRSVKEMNFPKPVHFSREDSPTGWKIKDWDTANALLSYLNTKGRSFVCFQKEDGSYVQCAGSKRRLTVEARIYNEDKSFKHLVFGKGQLKNEKEKVDTTDYHVLVDSSQVLQMRHARLIMKPWLEGEEFPSEFEVTDMTETLTTDQGSGGNG